MNPLDDTAVSAALSVPSTPGVHAMRDAGYAGEVNCLPYDKDVSPAWSTNGMVYVCVVRRFYSPCTW